MKWFLFLCLFFICILSFGCGIDNEEKYCRTVEEFAADPYFLSGREEQYCCSSVECEQRLFPEIITGTRCALCKYQDICGGFWYINGCETNYHILCIHEGDICPEIYIDEIVTSNQAVDNWR